MRVALISCSARKQDSPCIAAQMYAPSPLFSLSYEYSKLIADQIFILSAKHELLEENTYIEPYNRSLADLTSKERRIWSQNVIGQLKEKCDMENDEFIILAGEKYYKYLLPELSDYSIPLQHVTLFDRPTTLRKLIKQTKSKPEQLLRQTTAESTDIDICDELHILFNGMRHYVSSEIENVPFDNGIYVVFEKDEKYKEWQRIVRVGTHTAQDRLRARLKDHFIRENKDGSIFRKNLGKALLKQQDNPYLALWTLDTSNRENRERIDGKIQGIVENEVSSYLRENMSFAVFPVEDEQERLRIEEAIISSLNHADEFSPSDNWLGNKSPEEEIRNSGLWLKRGLNAEPLTHNELSFIQKCIQGQINTSPNASKSDRMQSINSKTIRNSPKIHFQKGVAMTRSSDIREYILERFEHFRARGEDTCILVSGDIHREMGLKNRMPMVCGVIRQLMRAEDAILNTTPSGQSSTIKIEYQLK